MEKKIQEENKEQRLKKIKEKNDIGNHRKKEVYQAINDSKYQKEGSRGKRRK